jgi:secondary thiamine-phosphate synthase enzyme
LSIPINLLSSENEVIFGVASVEKLHSASQMGTKDTPKRLSLVERSYLLFVQKITKSPYNSIRLETATIPLIRTEKLEVKTKGENDIVNVTNGIQGSLTRSEAKEGFLVLFLQSTTSALTIMEYEEGLLRDLPNAMEELAPKSGQYEHERAYHDGNGYSHVRSSIIGTSLSVPFANRKILLGTWQQIVLIEFDIRPRNRSLIVQIISE